MKVNALQDILGWFSEINAPLLYSLAKTETNSIKNQIANVQIHKPIYVCGLARSGTTILLELIAQNNNVGSFRYMDFPFAMIPYWWDKFLKMNMKSKPESVERSHKDGIKVTPESPEAMEEILWMHFFDSIHDPDINNSLDQNHRQDAFDTCYQDTIRKLLFSRNAKRYLAKNNYNVSRIEYLQSLFPDAKFVIPVRDPAWHIASLKKQHELLSKEESKDKRFLAYMRRSGHFEFGLGRKPLNLSSNENTQKVLGLWEEGKEIEGWAKYWADVHLYLAKVLEKNNNLAKSVLILNYEELCDNSNKVLSRLYDHIELFPGDGVIEKQGERLRSPSYYKPDFSDADLEIIDKETSEIHERILKLA